MKRRAGRGASSLGLTIGLVVAVHLGMGGGVFWLSQTDSGREFARLHKIKFFDETKKEEQAKAPEPPKPPPVVEKPAEAPKLASVPAPAAPTSSAPSVQIGGGGGGPNWAGGKFIGGVEDGPIGAFHAGVLGRLRGCFGSWPGPATGAEVSLEVDRQGSVINYHLVRGTGVSSDDERLVEAVRCVQSKGLSAPPDGVSRVVTLRLRPAAGVTHGQG